MFSYKAGVVLATIFIVNSMNPAFSATAQFNINNPLTTLENAGTITNINTSFDGVTNIFSWSSTITRNNGNLADGFWLVVTDGPFPQNGVDEYAVFYGDSNTGNLSTYVYDHASGGNTWQTPGEFVQSFAGPINIDNSVADQRIFSFSVDVSGINTFVPNSGSTDWDGTQFFNSLGIIFHPVVFADNPEYNNDGSLSDFSYQLETDYSISNVPVPAAVWLLLSAMSALFIYKKRKVV